MTNRFAFLTMAVIGLATSVCGRPFDATVDDVPDVVQNSWRMLALSGFTDIRIAPKDESREFIKDWAPGRGVEEYVVSATIEAVKPAGCCDSGRC